MARMDERTKIELYRINQERLFLSVIVIAFFLIVKISMQASIITMIGELVASGVIFCYLVPYFVIRYKYKVVDEMVKKKIYSLSTGFYVLQLFSQMPVIFYYTYSMINRIGDTPIKLMETSMPFIMALIMLTNIYALIRMHNEKFVSKSAAETDMPVYKKRILIRAVVATIILITILTVLIIINFVALEDYPPDSEVSATWAVVYPSIVMTCLLAIPMCWILYFYNLSARKKLERKLQAEQEAENKFSI